MSGFRFIHSSDLHLGRRFGNLPEAARGRLVEARHQILARLAEAARAHGAAHVLIAGDTFDSVTPTDPVWRQALSAMGADPALNWWLIPGNHDNLAAESLWQRFRHHAPANVHLLDAAAPVALSSGAVLLPAPLPQRRAGRELTAWMAACATAPDLLRIGLAHGAIHDFSEDGAEGEAIIPPDRAHTAGLDYLALGDWHGQMQVGDRTWYSGTPETDSFRHDRRGRGRCLAVTLTGPGALPQVAPIDTGTFSWATLPLPLLPGQSAASALTALLPPAGTGRRDHLLRVQATGRATLSEHAALRGAAEAAAPEFCHFVLDQTFLATEFESADLDEIDRAGALRLAAEALRTAAQDDTRDDDARRVSAAALNRLYGYLKEART